MERYEIKIKYEEIRNLMQEERYQEAMEIANTIDWDRSKNVNMLCMAGEIYERCGLYEDSKAIYLRAYQLQPQSRIIIYRLAELSIKLRDYADSIHFYKEYEGAAPYDVNLYVLKYKIYLARGASLETRIAILEELKENDYHERWAYELAKLYDMAGMTDKCVAECDEIFLWFGDGTYVKKALQLKKRYQPLTPDQQKKLEEVQPMPHKGEQTMQRMQEADVRRQTTQREYETLKRRDQEQPGDWRESEETEKARQVAIEAAREARAAQLLKEAEEEAESAEALQEEKDAAAFIGQGSMPQLQIEVPKQRSAPVMTAPEFKQPEVQRMGDAVEKQHDKDQTPPFGTTRVWSGLSGEKEAVREGQEEKSDQGAGTKTESDLLAERIALLLGGKISPQEFPGVQEPDTYDEDFISDDVSTSEVFLKDVDSIEEPELTDEYEPEDATRMEQARKAAAQTEAKAKAHPVEEDFFVDDYEQENPVDEDDSTQEDEEAFAKKEGAFHKMWKRTSDAVSKKPKATTIARQPEYDVQIRPVIVSRYDTINLQKELAKSIRAIMNATEKEEVEKTMEDINRSMELSNIPKLIQTKRLHIQEVQEALAEEKQELPRKKETLQQEVQVLDVKMQRLLGEEYDGQLRLLVEETQPRDTQIEGQICIEDILQAQEQQRLNEAKKKALARAEEYIDQLSVVVPYIGDMESVEVEDVQTPTGPEGNTKEDAQLLEQAQQMLDVRIESAEDITNIIQQLSDLLEGEQPLDAQSVKASEPEEGEEPAEEANEEVTEEAPAEEANEELTGEAPAEEANEEVTEEAPAEETPMEESPEKEPEKEPEKKPLEAEALKEAFLKVAKEPPKPKIAEALREASGELELDVPFEGNKNASEDSQEQTAENQKELTESSKKDLQKTSEMILSEQHRILSYFMKFGGVEEEISDFLKRGEDKGENLIITGTAGSGKMSLALRLLKTIASANPDAPKRIAKLSAWTMNQKPMDAIFAKVGEGTLIIEHAEDLRELTCEKLLPLLESYAGKVRVVMVGEEEPISQMLAANETLSSYFSYCFHLHEYNNNELVEFAKTYAQTKGYVMDEMAVLALYTRLAEAKKKKQAVMLGDVKEIVNHAITASETRKGVKNFLNTFLMKNVDEEGNMILREKDFEQV